MNKRIEEFADEAGLDMQLQSLKVAYFAELVRQDEREGIWKGVTAMWEQIMKARENT